MLKEVAKLRCIDAVEVPAGVFAHVPSHLVQTYRRRAATEPPRELRRHPAPRRYTLLAAFCCQRRKEIIDGLVDLLIHVVHRIGVRAERKVVNALLHDLRTVHGKTTLLFRIAEVAVNHPDGVIKEVVYPVVGKQTLHDLVREFKATGAAYLQEVHTRIRSCYGRHYRRMLSPLLGALTFRSNNAQHRPVVDALEFLRSHNEHRHRFFSLDEGVPIDGVIRPTLRDMVVETDPEHVVESRGRLASRVHSQSHRDAFYTSCWPRPATPSSCLGLRRTDDGGGGACASAGRRRRRRIGRPHVAQTSHRLSRRVLQPFEGRLSTWELPD